MSPQDDEWFTGREVTIIIAVAVAATFVISAVTAGITLLVFRNL